MANCPLRNSNDIKKAILNFNQQECNFQISCFKYGWMNPWWAVKLDKMHRPARLFTQAADQRSQDLPELYCPTGAIWIAQVQELFFEKSFYGEGHIFDPISWESAVDIDDYEDLRLAELLANKIL